MSDVNKPENINTDKNCFINPDQYKNHDAVAPIGSYPWAMIQLYLGNLMYRSNWDYPNEYIGLTPKSEKVEDDRQSYLIKKRKHNSFEVWQPTQDDMMACDWALVKPKPVDCMLSFDLKVGTSQYNGGEAQYWGYWTNTKKNPRSSPFGTLTNLQNTLDIGKISSFFLLEVPISTFSNLFLQVDTQNQPDLLNKNLEVIVNGSTYHLGPPSGSSGYSHTSDGAKQLGDLLKQNVGNTLHFCFNWK